MFKYVFLERSHNNQMFFGVLSHSLQVMISLVSCVRPSVSHVTTKFYDHVDTNFFVSSLSSTVLIFNVTTIGVQCYDHFRVSDCLVIIRSCKMNNL